MNLAGGGFAPPPDAPPFFTIPLGLRPPQTLSLLFPNISKPEVAYSNMLQPEDFLSEEFPTRKNPEKPACLTFVAIVEPFVW